MSGANTEDGAKGPITIAAFAFNYRGILAGLPLFYAFFSTRWESEREVLTWTIAIALVAAGALVRGWSRCHCSYGHKAKKTLSVTGPYALVRNPLYLGNLLMIAGAAVASELWWFVPVAVLWAVLVYIFTVRFEESRLAEKYGESFLEYRRQVPQWLPRLRRIKALPESLRMRDFWRVTGPQLVYSVLILSPFIFKELDLFKLWPRS